MPLTDAGVRALVPAKKAYRRADSRGLYIEVSPSGSKLWRYKFRYQGKEKRIALGVYPRVGLAQARVGRDSARLMLDQGVDPAIARKKDKATRRLDSGDTFSSVANELIRKREMEGLAPATIRKAQFFLMKLAPAIGSLPLAEITPQILLGALRGVEAAGLHETAKKARSFASRVFCFGVVTGRATMDPAAMLRGALVSPRTKHRAAILDEERLADYLLSAEGYPNAITRFALQILPHVFLRPGELRYSTWSDVNFEKAIWTVSAERMKMRREHRVPLSEPVIGLLRDVREVTGPTGFIFPAFHSRKLPMSENTLNSAMRRMGFTRDEVTAHGFRATASTFLNESGLFNPDAIERSLAHSTGSTVRGAYHRGQHWDERVKIARWWSARLNAFVVKKKSCAINCTAPFP